MAKTWVKGPLQSEKAKAAAAAKKGTKAKPSQATKAAKDPADKKAAKRKVVLSPDGDNRDVPVTALKGVGAKMAETLQNLRPPVETVGDLILHTPTRYQRLQEVKPIAAWQKGDVARVEVDIEMALVRRGSRARFVVAEGLDEKGKRVVMTWFGQHWLARQLPHRRVVVQGEIDQPLREKSPARLTVKEWEFSDDLVDKDYEASLRPVYPATSGLSQGRMRNLLGQALDLVSYVPDLLPEEMRERYQLPSTLEALSLVHRPLAETDPATGRHRLVFDELFPAQMALLLLRRRDANTPATALSDDSLSERLIAGLPFALSEGQVTAWSKVRHHLHGSEPSRILLQGEVGAGKTVIAALAGAQAAAQGKVTTILAPTEILASQHHRSLTEMLAPAGIKVELVTGSQPASERNAALERVASGESLVAVGTHALFSQGLEKFAFRLGLVVVDEQHRFGVAQRHTLVDAGQERGLGIHLLQLSATPIPRTLAMTVFGDLDVVDLPARAEAKRKVKTVVVADEYGWVAPMKEATARGDAAFVIVPRIEDTGKGWAIESPELQVWLRDFKHAFAHGQQPSAEREQALKDLANGEIDVLVATTVIEVGIDIKRASLIAILDADRFGLAQLHQLRGRVGRAGQAALCLLQPSVDAGEEGIERLAAMTRLDDGKELAEFDLEARGTGAFVGEAQAGKSGFRHAQLGRDARILVEARHAAKRLLEEDPTMAKPEHALLRQDLLQRIARMLAVRQS